MKKRLIVLLAALALILPLGAGVAMAGRPTPDNPNETGPEGKPCNADHDHPDDGLAKNKKCQPDPCADKGGDTDGDGICDDDEECPENVDDPANESCPTDPCADSGGDTDEDGICDDDEECPENVNDPTNSSCPTTGDLTCRARVVSADAGNDGADLSVIESNEPKDPCATDADGLAPATLPLPARILSTETNADGSSSSRVLDLGGGEGDPGRLSILGADADCDGSSDAWILLIQDGEGDVLRLDSDTLPDLSPDGSSGIFWTSEEDGHAQAILITGEPGSLRVVEAEACDA